MKQNLLFKWAVLVWLIFTSTLASATFNHVIGRVYHDQNADSTYNGSDTGLAGIKLFLHKDVNNNDSLDAGDELLDETITLVGGMYAFLFEHDADHEEVLVTVDTSTMLSPRTPRGPVTLAYSFTQNGTCPDDANFGFTFGECLLYGGNVVYYKQGMPPCEPCEGGLYKLVVRLSDTSITQRVKVSIKIGTLTAFIDSVDPGGLIIVQYPDSSLLPSDLDFYVNDTFSGAIHTSCSQPIGPGVDFGSFEVWRSYSIDLAPVCPPGEENCGECAGGMKEITFQYDGPLSNPKIKITDKNGTLYNDNVDQGEQFTITSIGGGRMGNEITVTINNCYHTKLHTSCSQPIYAGMAVGDLTLLSGQSVKGGYLCTFGEPNDNECGKCNKEVRSLTLKYIGSHSNPHVLIKKGKKTYWEGKVLKNQAFTITPQGKDNKLDRDLYFYVNWKKVGKYKMDCSADLTPGALLGDFEVVSATTKGDKEICDVTPPSGGGTCAECKGGVTYIKFRYTGSDPKVKFELKGGSTTYYSDSVSSNGLFSIGSKTGSKLEKDVEIYMNGVLHSKIHTSCSQPIEPGVRAGTLVIEESWSEDNGEICPGPPTSGCVPCKDALKSITLRYDGTATNVKIEVKEGKDKVYEGTLNPGDLFTFGGNHSHGFHKKIDIKVDGDKNAEFYTDCSGPVGPGVTDGDFTMISGVEENGQVICDVDVTNCGNCEGGLRKLSILYQGGSAKTVKIVGKSTVYFNQTVQPNTIITITKGASERRIVNEIDLYLNNVKNTSIHTSCSQPIYPGLVFGNFMITEAISNKGGEICPEEPFCFPTDSLNLTYILGEPDDLGTLLTGGAEIIVDLFDTLLQSKNYNIRAALEGISVSDSAVLDIYESLNGVTYSAVKHITVNSTDWTDFTLTTSNKTRYIVIQNPDTNACVSIDAIIYDCDAVPVEMLSFDGYIESPVLAKLFWETSLEIDNEKFIIERRFEHEDAFRAVGTVEGVGNSTAINNYSFNDNTAGYRNGNIYYRLKQVDFSGQFEYSDILVLGLLGKNDIVIAPNPGVRATTVVFPQGKSIRNYTVEIFSMDGLNITDQVTQEKNDHMLDLDFGNMAGGFYFVRIENGDHVTVKKILIK